MNIDDKIARAALYAEHVSIKARYNAAKGYVLNTNLQLECHMLIKQMEELEIEIEALDAKGLLPDQPNLQHIGRVVTNSAGQVYLEDERGHQLIMSQYAGYDLFIKPRTLRYEVTKPGKGE